MYASDTGTYDGNRRLVLTKTWQPGLKPVQGDWTVIEVSFEKDDLNNGLQQAAVVMV